MLIKSQNLALTLFVSVLLSLAVTSVEAHDFAQPVRRDHNNLKRLIKKRSPQLGIINVVPDPDATTTTTTTDPAATDSTSVTASAPASASATGGTSVSESASNAESVSASGASQSASASASGSGSVSASSASASLTSASSSQSSSTFTTVKTSAPAAQTPAANADTNTDQPPASQTQSTVTRTNSVLAAAETNANNSTTSNSGLGTSSPKSTISTVLIVVAASVGGVAILWTIFRKWKLGHSKKFDERMAPIDWQPTTDDGIIPAHRRTNSRASSFNSAAHGNAGYTDRDHDFTAAPSHLAPVGGYADLARGPSPQPQMQEAYGQGLARGPSTTRPAYDNGLPLHHQAGYGQAEAYDYNGDAIRF